MTVVPESQHYRLSKLQRRRKYALAVLAAATILLMPFVASVDLDSIAHEAIETIGFILIGIAILGRAWCTLYIGGSKARQLIETGPYSVSRNPLYLFSFIGAAGIGAQSGTFTMALISLGLTLAVFIPVVLKEEQALSALFGASFNAYKARVPPFLPRFSAWRDRDEVTVNPRILWRTLRDGLVFVSVIPVFELIDYLQKTGRITPFIYLP